MDFYATFLRRIPQRNTIRFNRDSRPMTVRTAPHRFARRIPASLRLYLQEVARIGDKLRSSSADAGPQAGITSSQVAAKGAGASTVDLFVIVGKICTAHCWNSVGRMWISTKNCQWREPQVIQELLCHTDLRIIK